MLFQEKKFKNLVKATNMNDIKAEFQKYEGSIYNVGHFIWNYINSRQLHHTLPSDHLGTTDGKLAYNM